MNWVFLVPVLITATIVFGIVIDNWVKMRHGYAPSDTKPGSGLDAERRIALLTNENEKLLGLVSRLEERIAVLERIATDPAERTAREIDGLR